MRAGIVTVLGWGLAAGAPAADTPPAAEPVPERIAIAEGPFRPAWDSLKQYRCPDWFRDAKLGFWAILGPQSVPEAGDWYARNLYLEGSPQYRHHLERYGHPSTNGYQDLIALFRAEKLDADRLAGLYQRAGARYLVVLANHHDNYDCWNSRYHRWNSVRTGPRKDLVGLFRDAARARGLRFGVTEHNARSFTWFSVNKGADKQGPLAGVRYDGWATNRWDLYHPPHSLGTAAGDLLGPDSPVPDAWKRAWFYRTRDLVDAYQPDLLYTDGAVPFGEVGRSLVAHFYNANAAAHGGRLEAVYTCKDWGAASGHGEFVPGTCVQDVERGVVDDLRAEPWQIDTCIGDWYYRQGVRYKTPQTVIAILADVVSKNGNLLLNVPLRHDGSIDAEEEKVLEGLAGWMAAHGEAIYGTRPWKVFGESARRIRTGHFNEGVFAQMGAGDIRFTAKGDVLYALAMGWPADGALRIRSLAAPPGGAWGELQTVELVGRAVALACRRGAEALEVTLPAEAKTDYPLVLRLRGRGLAPAPAGAAVAPREPEADGRVVLRAADAEIHGDSPRYETGGGKDNIGYWANPADHVSWAFRVPRPGRYTVDVTYSCEDGREGSRFDVAVGDRTVTGASRPTGSWATFARETLGTIELDRPGVHTLAVKPRAEPRWQVIGLQAVTLIPAGP